jgi:hypothetical protein
MMLFMDIAEVDERDSTWEQHESVFRVYFAQGIDRSITTFDVSHATFSEVRKWATETALDDTIIAIALVGLDSRGLKGLTWLFGMDPNDHPAADIEIRMHAEMNAVVSAVKSGGPAVKPALENSA